MALEKITIATEEKQDKILQDISLVSSSVNQLAQKTVDTSNLADKNDIEKMKNLIAEMGLSSLLQIKTGTRTKESNCKYLLIGVQTRTGDYIFHSLKAIDTSNSYVEEYNYKKYITDKTTKFDNKTFYLLKTTLIVTGYDMYGDNSALMLKLH